MKRLNKKAKDERLSSQTDGPHETPLLTAAARSVNVCCGFSVLPALRTVFRLTLRILIRI